MKPGGAEDPESSQHLFCEHPFRGQRKIIFASQVGKGLAWLAPGFCGDIKTEGHGEFPNAHLPCTYCGGKWLFLVLPLVLWFWGQNVSGDNWPAVACQQCLCPGTALLVEVEERE